MSDLEKSFDAWIHAAPEARAKFISERLEKVDSTIELLEAERVTLRNMLGKGKPGRKAKAASNGANGSSNGHSASDSEEIFSESVFAAISELGAEGAGVSRSDVQGKLGISDGQWSKAVKELGKRLKIKGERRATRYFVAAKK